MFKSLQKELIKSTPKANFFHPEKGNCLKITQTDTLEKTEFRKCPDSEQKKSQTGETLVWQNLTKFSEPTMPYPELKGNHQQKKSEQKKSQTGETLVWQNRKISEHIMPYPSLNENHQQRNVATSGFFKTGIEQNFEQKNSRDSSTPLGHNSITNDLQNHNKVRLQHTQYVYSKSSPQDNFYLKYVHLNGSIEKLLGNILLSVTKKSTRGVITAVFKTTEGFDKIFDWMTISQLAKRGGICVSSAKTAIKEVIDMGIIIKEVRWEKGTKKNFYSLNQALLTPTQEPDFKKSCSWVNFGHTYNNYNTSYSPSNLLKKEVVEERGMGKTNQETQPRQASATTSFSNKKIEQQKKLPDPIKKIEEPKSIKKSPIPPIQKEKKQKQFTKRQLLERKKMTEQDLEYIYRDFGDFSKQDIDKKKRNAINHLNKMEMQGHNYGECYALGEVGLTRKFLQQERDNKEAKKKMQENEAQKILDAKKTPEEENYIYAKSRLEKSPCLYKYLSQSITSIAVNCPTLKEILSKLPVFCITYSHRDFRPTFDKLVEVIEPYALKKESKYKSTNFDKSECPKETTQNNFVRSR